MSLPKPTGPATRTKVAQGGASDVHDLKVDKATALSNGVALPPLEAPEQVMDIIRAGNTIARTPYKWGGGHGSFQDNGYDCSGSVSYALYAAGLIGGSATSGELTDWGKPGKGRWITVYANGGHTFMEVAGIRFDTSGTRVTGSRWQNEFRPTGGFVARHPAGLSTRRNRRRAGGRAATREQRGRARRRAGPRRGGRRGTSCERRCSGGARRS